jgi:prolyl 4-hydroxylase
MHSDDPRERFAAIVDLLRKPGPVNRDYVAPEVEACAQAGVLEAMVLAACLAGAGWGRTQDWRVALAWLASAAAAGSEPAQKQLRLLSGGQANDWGTLAARVDLDARCAAEKVRVETASPWIAASEALADEGLCRWLIDRALPKQARAMVYDAHTGRPVQDQVRTNTEAVFPLIDIDLPMLLLRERIANTVGVPVSHLENLAVFRYTPGQRFGPHVDYLSPTRDRADIAANGQRTHTFLVYLNDSFDGGETNFIDLGFAFRGKAGEALLWRNTTDGGEPDVRTRHEGLPPARGEKWLLSVFIRDKPQAFG